MQKPRILIVATTTGYQVRAFGEAAERQGGRACLRYRIDV